MDSFYQSSRVHGSKLLGIFCRNETEQTISKLSSNLRFLPQAENPFMRRAYCSNVDFGMAVSQELCCFGRVLTIRSSHSRSLLDQRGCSSTSARPISQYCSSTIMRQFLVEVSSNNSLRPNDHSQRHRLHNSAECANAGPSVVRRRELMEICFISGLVTATALQPNEAEALDKNGERVQPTEVGLEEGRVRSCEGSTPCVSTSSFRSPSRFMPPWQYLGPQKDAYGELLKALKRMGAEIMKIEDGRYVYATMSTPSSKEDIDDLEFLFVGKVVCFRSLSRKTALDPPFCWWPGCINGPANRGRMEALRDDLGWIPLETDEDKAWTPIFLR